MTTIITKNRFTPDQWQSLLYAPLIVFNIVAGADGKIDQKEISAFKRLLVEGLLSDMVLIKLLMGDLLEDLENLTYQVFSKGLNPNECVDAIRTAVDDTLPADEALAFKLALLDIGKKIAQASGEELGDRICLSEKQAMARLAVVLHVINPPAEDKQS